MTYRRSQETGVFSSRWRIAHRAQLAECGILGDVTNSDRLWNYVLLHGNNALSGWDTTSLSEEQARNLLELLDTELPNAIGIDLIDILRRRVH